MKLRYLLSILLPLSITLSACGTDDQCNDGSDNDGDGLIDAVDPGCEFNGDKESPDPILTACNDGVDNDGDGLVDTGDPGCADSLDEDEFNEPISDCNDGIDNDSDGLVDFPNDPGCDLSLKDSEEDDCPSGPNCPACGNGSDDDDDALSDYPDDPGCNSAGDTSEFNGDPSTCGTAVLIQPLPVSGSIMGQVLGEQPNELISGDCGGAGEEQVYTYTLATPRTLVITTDFAETEIDTVVYVRTTCRDPLTEIGCNDDDGLNVSTLTLDRVEAGDYFIIVDTQGTTTTGNYRLDVIDFTPEKEACNAAAPDCAPGLHCRLFDGAISETCEQPECSDGITSDDDLLLDFPDDPGCDSPEDNDETDDCLGTGATCPACGNGLEDDGDGLTDYDPNGDGDPSDGDPGCSYAGDNLEIDECTPGVTVIDLPEAGVTGTTPLSSVGSNFSPSCDSFNSSTEDVYAFRNDRNLASLSFSTDGSVGDTVLSVRFDDCADIGAQVACENPSGGGANVTIDAPTQNEFYYVFVDGDFSSAIDYQLNVSGRIAAGESCQQGNTQFTCVDGFFCGGGNCVATECNNGTNDDADTKIDYPFDPGCLDINDNDEADNCPGVGCPQCGNQMDDDGDGFVDFEGFMAFGPDMGCESASDNLELDDCIPGVPLLSLSDSGVTGTTEASGNSDFNGSCSTSTFSSEDEYAYLNPRVLTNLTFSTVGSAGDTVLYVRENNCGLTADEVGCAQAPNAGEEVTIPNPTTDAFYFVFVDGDFVSAIDYVLNVSGTLGVGQACSAGDTQFVCDPMEGLLCTANTCSLAQCNDGVTNDGDALIDFADPGCSSIIDNNEADDPAPAPACFDNMDNDGDGDVDYPDDLGCTMASDDNEQSCLDSDPIVSVTMPAVAGNTATATNDFTPSCSTSSTANDIAHEIFFPGDLDSLVVNTDGSSYDTVLYMRANACSDVDYDCDDDGGLGLQSQLDLTNVPSGVYYFIVDGFSSGSGTYNLSVTGVVRSGEACDMAQVTAGIVSCATGTTCTAGTCQ